MPDANRSHLEVTRREFLKLIGAGCAVTGIGYSIPNLNTTLSGVTLEEISIKIRTLPKNFEGYRIGFLTDLHLGPRVPHDLIYDSIQLLFKAQIDLLLLGGDYIWIPSSSFAYLTSENKNFRGVRPADLPKKIYAEIFRMLGEKLPRDGMYGVLGNHDRWIDPRAALKSFAEFRTPLLINSSATISRGNQALTIIGTDDYLTGIPKLPTLSAKLPEREARILLNHNPDFLDEALAGGNPLGIDLSIGGHTHGGQIVLPLVGALTYNISNLQYSVGLYHHPSGAQCYTSRGVGVVEIPFRINCPPEVTVFELSRG